MKKWSKRNHSTNIHRSIREDEVDWWITRPWHYQPYHEKEVQHKTTSHIKRNGIIDHYTVAVSRCSRSRLRARKKHMHVALHPPFRGDMGHFWFHFTGSNCPLLMIQVSKSTIRCLPNTAMASILGWRPSFVLFYITNEKNSHFYHIYANKAFGWWIVTPFWLFQGTGIHHGHYTKQMGWSICLRHASGIGSPSKTSFFIFVSISKRHISLNNAPSPALQRQNWFFTLQRIFYKSSQIFWSSSSFVTIPNAQNNRFYQTIAHYATTRCPIEQFQQRKLWSFMWL